MRLVEIPALEPAQHLALDALLLDKAEAGEIGETVRLWMSGRTFVVIGRGGKVERECHVDRCRADGVPILRRVSGGGAVVQGPGCLNFSLVLGYDRDPALRDIRGSYERILSQLAAALSQRGQNVQFLPTSDLAIDGRKVSGNAQARRRRFFLHHGTFLMGFDHQKLDAYLPHPPREPPYRGGRPHQTFVTNLPLAREQLETIILDLFPPDQPPWTPSRRDQQTLRASVAQRFAADAWTFAR